MQKIIWICIPLLLMGATSLRAQCDLPLFLSTSGISTNQATLHWDVQNIPIDDHCWTIEVFGVGAACGDGNWIYKEVICEGDPGVFLTGNTISWTLLEGTLQPGTSYQFAIVETCDGMAPPDNVSPCATSDPFITLDDPFQVDATNILEPSCPLVSPGFTPDGSFDILLSDGLSCPSALYDVVVLGQGAQLTYPVSPAIINGVTDGVYSFMNAGPGTYTIEVTELENCNPLINPMTIEVVVPDGIDVTAPVIDIFDPFLGNPITAIGPFTLPEGSCSYQFQFYVNGFDNCDGFIIAPDAVAATAVTTPGTVDPGTQVNVEADGFGFYLVTVNFAVGTTALTVSLSDAAGNVTSTVFDVVIEDNINPAVSMLGGFNYTIPFCEDNITATVTIQIDDLCDQSVNADNLDVSFNGTEVLNFTGSNYFEFFVTISTDDHNDLWTAAYTDYFGNNSSFNVAVQVEAAAEDLPAVIIAADENIATAACDDEIDIAYSFQIIDDCSVINVEDINFDDDGAGLAITFVDEDPANNSVFVEVSGAISAATDVYVLEIEYQGTVLEPLLNVVQEAEQTPDIQLPGNLVFTIPACEAEVEVSFAIQINDDCDTSDDIAANATFSLGGTELFPSFVNELSNNSVYFEFEETLTTANNGDLLLASYGGSSLDAFISVNDQPDNWAPIIIYPSQDIVIEMDPCEPPTAITTFEITATDNCDGEIPFDLFFVPAVSNVSVVASSGGPSVIVTAPPGQYNIVVAATDNAGNTRQENFELTIIKAPAPVAEVACLDSLQVVLDENCQLAILPGMVLTGNLGCLESDDFEVLVEDDNPSNGNIADGCGVYDYQLTLGNAIQSEENFTGFYGMDHWVFIQQPPATSIIYAQEQIQLSISEQATNANDAYAMVPLAGNGTLAFDYQHEGPPSDWSWFIRKVDGTIVEEQTFESQGNVEVDVEVGDIFGIQLQAGSPIPDELSSIIISNFTAPLNVDTDFSNCWGRLSVIDETPPTIDCPEDTDQANITENLQFLSGELSVEDPVWDQNDHICFIDIVNPEIGDHYYDEISFSITNSDTYTFELASAWGDGWGALFQGSFDPEEPCANLVARIDNNLNGTGFFSNFDPVFRITLPLLAGETYVLVTSSWPVNTTGAYNWAVYNEGDGQIIEVSTVQETITLDLICEDGSQAVLEEPQTWNVGQPIPEPLASKLGYTGFPAAMDNCNAVAITVSDSLYQVTSCAESFIERTFAAVDEKGNADTCVQVIAIRKPNLEDVTLPPINVSMECDEGFAVNNFGNPSPSVSGFPFVRTAFGFYSLEEDVCGLSAGYTDAPRIDICPGAYRFRRQWTMLNWCAPGNSVVFNQFITVGDFSAPIITCPLQDINNDGIGDIAPVYSTGPLDCTAAIEIPLPEVEDNCSDFQVVTKVFINTDAGLELFATIEPEAPNRFVADIPLGCHVIQYLVTDGCGNFSTESCEFCIEDQTDPVAICNDDVNISLGGNGTAILTVTEFDEGSWDNCALESIEIRRLITEDAGCNPTPEYYSPWTDNAFFSCCDVNDFVLIELRVRDTVGNTNLCWLSVFVEDKINPECIAPDATSISCNDLPADFDHYDIQQLQDLFGSADASDNCSADWEELVPIVNIDDCGIGSILRRFKAADLVGNESDNTCSQLITIFADFNYEIKFPKDFEGVCGDPAPDTIMYNEIGCDLLAVSVDDEYFPASDGGCFKIHRTYQVINWCEYDGESDPIEIGRDEDCDGEPGDEDIWVLVRGVEHDVFYDQDSIETNSIPMANEKGISCDSMTNPLGYWKDNTMDPGISSNGFWRYTQVIRAYDDIAPEIIFNPPPPFCSLDNEDCDGPIDYLFNVLENCTPDDLTFILLYDEYADGIIDDNLTDDGVILGQYPKFKIEGEYPIGEHIFEIVITDGCGNTTGADLPFEVVDCKAPAPICINGLAVELMPVLPGEDADGDGDEDTGAMTIWASDFIASPIEDCLEPITYSINKVGETPDINQSSLTLTCDDPATIFVEVYAWDDAFNPEAVQPDSTIGGPNYDFCETYILIQDNMCLCGCDGDFLITGTINTEDNNPLAAVQVDLSGDGNEVTFTNEDGSYILTPDLSGQDFTITPISGEDYLNGVSTFDIVLISKHILGVQYLDSPYKRIAADINKSGSISTLDLIKLRKVILSIDIDFGTNNSWRFLPSSFEFEDGDNPFSNDFPEFININNLEGDLSGTDFIGVKVGDVNGSASFQNGEVEDRSGWPTEQLFMKDLPLVAGEQQEISISVASTSLEGIQFSLAYDPESIKIEAINEVLFSTENMGLSQIKEGILHFSWNGAVAQSTLFNLSITALKTISTKDLFWISKDRGVKAESYQVDGSFTVPELFFIKDIAADWIVEVAPNPFTNYTKLCYSLEEAGSVTLQVTDPQGQLVYDRILNNEQGRNCVELGSDILVEPGIYFYQLKNGDQHRVGKLIRL